MQTTLIVNQRHIQRLRERKTCQLTARGIVNRCRTFSDILPLHHQYHHLMHAVTVHTFRRRHALLLRNGFDAELVHFYMP